MGINFLYWNVYNKGKQLADTIAKIVNENKIDILTLSEVTLHKEEVESIVMGIENASNLKYFKANKKDNDDPWIYVFFAENKGFSLQSIAHEFRPDWKELTDSTQLREEIYFTKYQERNERMLFLKLIHGNLETLLVPIHFPSRMYATPRKQEALAEGFNRYIKFIEERNKLARTIVYGDFNMSPYEAGMIDYRAFHALPDRRLLDKEIRHLHIPYKPYYNPSWQLLGDYSVQTIDQKLILTDEPTATYFKEQSSDVDYYWYLFDQVLLRKEIIDDFDLSAFRIIKGHEGLSLLNENLRPDKDKFSDHLPIIFRIK